MTAPANKLPRFPALLLSLCFAFGAVAHAQYQGSTTPPAAGASTNYAFSQQELDQMLAPIALYPDPLLSQILMAATYPLEVVEAARWSKNHPNLAADEAVRAVGQNDWDGSVKSLVAFPQILREMDEKLDWTERLGDAFLSQQPQVMDTVQRLRQKAYAAGNLVASDRIRVEQQGQTIVVEAADPSLLYVPYYDPAMVYGAWWWPAYPPIFWAPWPGYYFSYGFAWGAAIALGPGFFFGDMDWQHHRVAVRHGNNFYYRRGERLEGGGQRRIDSAPWVWQHDPVHRRGAPYRQAATLRQFDKASSAADERRNFRGYDGGQQGSYEFSAPAPASRGAPIVNPLPPAPAPARNPIVEPLPPALENIGRAREVRSYSTRGRESFRQSGPEQHGIAGPAGQADGYRRYPR